MYLTAEEFEQIVSEGIEAVPKEFLDKLDNVAITIADDPSFSQRQMLHLRPWMNLFGLYEGIPPVKRAANYGSVLPDKITIFKNPILARAHSLEDARLIVRNTVWHEIAHHFGMDEKRVREAEKERLANSQS